MKKRNQMLSWGTHKPKVGPPGPVKVTRIEEGIVKVEGAGDTFNGLWRLVKAKLPHKYRRGTYDIRRCQFSGKAIHGQTHIYCPETTIYWYRHHRIRKEIMEKLIKEEPEGG